MYRHAKTCPMNPSKVKILCKECGRSFTTTQSRTAHERTCRKKCQEKCKFKAAKPIVGDVQTKQPTKAKQNVVVNGQKKVEQQSQNVARSDSSTMTPSQLSIDEAPLGLPVKQIVPSWLTLYEEYKGETNRKQIVRMVKRLVLHEDVHKYMDTIRNDAAFVGAGGRAIRFV
jgi:hypothetical protein